MEDNKFSVVIEKYISVWIVIKIVALVVTVKEVVIKFIVIIKVIVVMVTVIFEVIVMAQSI